MPLPPVLQSVPFPVIGAPLFIVSNPKMVIAQCTAGVVGSMPALERTPGLVARLMAGRRSPKGLAAWNRAITQGVPAAPFAMDQIVHKTNDRPSTTCGCAREYEVPIVITPLEKGADGLIAVAAGAGGQPAARCSRRRRWARTSLLHRQHRSTWAFEIVLRPWVEKW